MTKRDRLITMIARLLRAASIDAHHMGGGDSPNNVWRIVWDASRA